MALNIMGNLIRTISAEWRTCPHTGGYKKMPRIVRGHHKIETKRLSFYIAASPPVIGGDHRGGMKELNTSLDQSIVRRNKTVNLFPHV